MADTRQRNVTPAEAGAWTAAPYRGTGHAFAAVTGEGGRGDCLGGLVIAAQAAIQEMVGWIPAFAGMTSYAKVSESGNDDVA